MEGRWPASGDTWPCSARARSTVCGRRVTGIGEDPDLMEAMARPDGPSGAEARPPRRVRHALNSLGQRLGLLPEPPGDNLFHGFISYSHQADQKLAVALQQGLHRFAKPWYQARALHVFRDEAALSANPDLWDSVREAMDSS